MSRHRCQRGRQTVVIGRTTWTGVELTDVRPEGAVSAPRPPSTAPAPLMRATAATTAATTVVDKGSPARVGCVLLLSLRTVVSVLSRAHRTRVPSLSRLVGTWCPVPQPSLLGVPLPDRRAKGGVPPPAYVTDPEGPHRPGSVAGQPSDGSTPMTEPYDHLLEAYARLVVRIGVNVQLGQRVVVRGMVEHADVARAVAAEAYRVGASHVTRSEEHTSELQSPCNLVCRLLLEK